VTLKLLQNRLSFEQKKGLKYIFDKVGRKTVSNNSCEYHQSKIEVIDSFAHEELILTKELEIMN